MFHNLVYLDRLQYHSLSAKGKYTAACSSETFVSHVSTTLPRKEQWCKLLSGNIKVFLTVTSLYNHKQAMASCYVI